MTTRMIQIKVGSSIIPRPFMLARSSRMGWPEQRILIPYTVPPQPVGASRHARPHKCDSHAVNPATDRREAASPAEARLVDPHQAANRGDDALAIAEQVDV
jgi:hypothetical protein